MAASAPWRPPRALRGPEPMRLMDIEGVNRVFSDAFTERYRRDGMAGVRVPQLNPAIWRYAIEDARDGAMLWRDDRGEVIAFNVAHVSGVEGWMGPLAVRPEWQGTGLGKTIVRAGVDWLKAHGAQTIGLETMPRTIDNIGFYSTLGFQPGRLTITLTLDAAEEDGAVGFLGDLPPRQRSDALHLCRELTKTVAPGYDFTRELDLTLQLGLGDVVLVWDDANLLAGFALFHAVPLVDGRARDELRVLKCVLRDISLVPRLIALIEFAARRAGTRRCAVRVQTAYLELYQRLVAAGARVRWTDLRMTVGGYEERPPVAGVVLSNWEI